jgi:hypothetical protein
MPHRGLVCRAAGGGAPRARGMSSRKRGRVHAAPFGHMDAFLLVAFVRIVTADNVLSARDQRAQWPGRPRGVGRVRSLRAAWAVSPGSRRTDVGTAHGRRWSRAPSAPRRLGRGRPPPIVRPAVPGTEAAPPGAAASNLETKIEIRPPILDIL